MRDLEACQQREGRHLHAHEARKCFLRRAALKVLDSLYFGLIG